MWTVLVTDHPAPTTDVEAAVLAAVDARLVVSATGAEDDLVRLAPEADAILTCFAQVTPAVIRAAPKLQVVGRYGVGVDNIAVETATDLGVVVANVPVYCVDEVAEHVLALYLSLARRITRYDRQIRIGNWSIETGMPIHRITGSTLGIVGFGRIGRAVAERALGLGIRVLAYDPMLDPQASTPPGVTVVDLDTLLGRADAVTLHTPLTPETHHLINEQRLTLMKPGAFLLNASRGGVIDLDALEAALRVGTIAGAGLDVFEPERLPEGHPLLQLESVVATPHVAFYSEESISDLERLAAGNVAVVLAGGLPQTAVNPSVLELERWQSRREGSSTYH
jgi:D-3-phosphoglycerate dehydrogenase